VGSSPKNIDNQLFTERRKSFIIRILSFTVKMIKKHPLAQRCQGLAGVVFRRKVVVYLLLFFVLQNFFDLGLRHNLFT
jgi:hypothetical protein